MYSSALATFYIYRAREDNNLPCGPVFLQGRSYNALGRGVNLKVGGFTEVWKKAVACDNLST